MHLRPRCSFAHPRRNTSCNFAHRSPFGEGVFGRTTLSGVTRHRSLSVNSNRLRPAWRSSKSRFGDGTRALNDEQVQISRGRISDPCLSVDRSIERLDTRYSTKNLRWNVHQEFHPRSLAIPRDSSRSIFNVIERGEDGMANDMKTLS